VRGVSLIIIACGIQALLSLSQASAQSYKRAYSMPDFSAMPAPAAPTGDATDGGPARSLTDGRSAFTPFGFSIPRVSTSMLPQPVAFDPTDMLMQEAKNKVDFGSGYAIVTEDGTDAPLAVFRIVPNVKLDLNYDTGNPGSALSPATFALRDSPEDRESGIFSLATSKASLKSDIQIPSVSAQVFMEIIEQEGEGDLDFRQIYGRAGNWLGGEYYTSFSDSGTLPQSIVPDGSPAGAINDPSVVQLQYVKLYQSGVLVGVAIENPTLGDFSLVDPDDARLHRIPDLITRVRYQPLDSWGSWQGAMLLRHFGYQELGGDEHFTPAVSFSSNMRFKVYDDNNVRMGVVGGEGAGNRIFGLNVHPIAGGPVNGDLEALENYGAYASYQHYWNKCLLSNAAYGYAFADTTPGMGTFSRESQNGWVNLIWNNPNGKIAIGLEYQFGELEVGDGSHGFNHHIQLSLQIGKGYDYPTDAGTSGESTTESVLPSGMMAPNSMRAADAPTGPLAPAVQPRPATTTPAYPRL